MFRQSRRKEIAAVGKDNAAVTILPAKNNAVKIFESKIINTEYICRINLGVADPADDSKDYTGVITRRREALSLIMEIDIGKAFDKE